MKTLESMNQAFVADAVSTGVRLLGVVPGEHEWVAYQLDDSARQASRALGLWTENKAFCNAKEYARMLQFVKRAANDIRYSKPIKGEFVTNGNRTV